MDTEEDFLKLWREKRGWSVARAAKEANVSRSAWGRYETRARLPEWPVINRLVILSGGELDANAWLDKEARDVVAMRLAGA